MFVSELAAQNELAVNLPGDRNRTGHWVLGELSMDGTPIAIEIGAVEGHHYYSFLGAFDSDWSSYSPGKVQIECMIGWALEYGIRDFDFLCVTAQYKSDWTDKSIAVHHFNKTLGIRGRLYHSIWLKRLRPAAKNSLHKLNEKQRDKVLLAGHWNMA